MSRNHRRLVDSDRHAFAGGVRCFQVRIWGVETLRKGDELNHCAFAGPREALQANGQIHRMWTERDSARTLFRPCASNLARHGKKKQPPRAASKMVSHLYGT